MLGLVTVGLLAATAIARADEGAQKGPVLADARPAPTSATADASARERTEPPEKASRPSRIRKRGFDNLLSSMRPPNLAPLEATPWPPIAEPRRTVESFESIATPARLGLRGELGLFTRSAQPAGLGDLDSVRRHTMAIGVSPKAALSSGVAPRTERLEPADGGRADGVAVHHESVLARRSDIHPGLAGIGESLLASIGESPPERGEIIFDYEGVHKLAFKGARHHFRKILKNQIRDDFKRDSGGDIFVALGQNTRRASNILNDHFHGRRFPRNLWEALEVDGQVDKRRQVKTLGAKVNITSIGPLRLRNDFRLLYDKIDLDLFQFLRSDDPVDDWDYEYDEAESTSDALVVADDGQTSYDSSSAEVPSVRRRLIPRGNLYTGDSVSLDGRIRLRLRRQSKIQDTIASSVSLRLKAVFYGGAHHRPLFEARLEARFKKADDFVVTLDLIAIPF